MRTASEERIAKSAGVLRVAVVLRWETVWLSRSFENHDDLSKPLCSVRVKRFIAASSGCEVGYALEGFQLLANMVLEQVA
jgi:hypothetical protein